MHGLVSAVGLPPLARSGGGGCGDASLECRELAGAGEVDREGRLRSRSIRDRQGGGDSIAEGRKEPTEIDDLLRGCRARQGQRVAAAAREAGERELRWNCGRVCSRWKMQKSGFQLD